MFMKDIRKNSFESLYVHIPFCNSICFYCDFARGIYAEKKADDYLRELLREIAAVKDQEIKTIYVGGGTPTSLNCRQLEELLAALAKYDSVEEFSVEINPESFSLEKAGLFRRYGVNRVSVGVQSFDQKLLKEMNRQHSLSEVRKTFDLLHEAGIANISIDLIYGFRRQGIQDVIRDLEQALKLGVTHISIYELELHENSVFAKKGYPEVDDELSCQIYTAIIRFLKDNGFEHYEVSNFAKPDHQSSHNKAYWHYDNYYGAGIGASGKLDNYRYTNTLKFSEYLKGNYRGEELELSRKDVEFEAIMMGLRLLEGLNIENFNSRYGCDLLAEYQKAVEKNVRQRKMTVEDNSIRLTEKGLLMLNDVLVDFMELM